MAFSRPCDRVRSACSGNFMKTEGRLSRAGVLNVELGWRQGLEARPLSHHPQLCGEGAQLQRGAFEVRGPLAQGRACSA